MILHPYDAARLVLTGTKYLFWVRGISGKKTQWLEQVRELVATDNPEVTLGILGKPGSGLGFFLGDVINDALQQKHDSLYCPSQTLTRKEEIRIRGVAIALDYRLVIVDNFLNAEERLSHPEVIPANNSDISLPSTIIIDLDGTIADSYHRSPLKYEPEEIAKDSVIKHVAEIKYLYNLSGVNTHFVTARGYDVREVSETQKWLKDKRIWRSGDVLLHRSPGDNRSDAVVKLELFNKHIRDKYNVRLVIDDRPSVVRLWHDLGLPVLANKAYIRGEF